MSKELSEETKYEFNVFSRQLNKDLSNLMDCLRKQDKDNKAILYAGRHIQKIILPVEEYQKMCQRLEAIDNSNPSEALEWLNRFKGIELSSLPFKSEDGAVKEVDLNDVRFVGSQLNNDFRKFVYIIENALIKAQEQEKVLKVVFEKPLSLLTLKLFKKYDKDRVLELDYQFFVDGYKTITEDLDEDMKEKIDTEEEFDLLKRYYDEQNN